MDIYSLCRVPHLFVHIPDHLLHLHPQKTVRIPQVAVLFSQVVKICKEIKMCLLLPKIPLANLISQYLSIYYIYYLKGNVLKVEDTHK